MHFDADRGSVDLILLLYCDSDSPVKGRRDILMKTENYQARMLSFNPCSVCMTADKSLDHSETPHAFRQATYLGLNVYMHLRLSG